MKELLDVDGGTSGIPTIIKQYMTRVRELVEILGMYS